MSAIGAKTFFFFEGNTQPREHTVRHPDYFQTSLFKLPQNGVTLLYGHKGPGSLIGAAVRKSAELDKGVCFVDVKINIGEWNTNKQQLDNFDNFRFLNLPLRANRAILDDINRHWNYFLDQEGAPHETFPRKPSQRMDLLDKLMALPPYNALNAIAYDVVTKFGVTKFVTVYKPEAIRKSQTTVIPPGTDIHFATPNEGHLF